MSAVFTPPPPGCRYDRDPRVIGDPDREGFTIRADDGTRVYIYHTADRGWCILTGPGRHPIVVAGGGHADNIATADAPIGAVIGDPQPSAHR